MPAKPRWLLAISDAVSQLENLDRTRATWNGSSGDDVALAAGSGAELQTAPQAGP